MKKNSILELINYFSKSGVSNQKCFSPNNVVVVDYGWGVFDFVYHPELPLFFTWVQKSAVVSGCSTSALAPDLAKSKPCIISKIITLVFQTYETKCYQE